MNMFAKLALTAAFAALLIPGVAAAQSATATDVEGGAMKSSQGSEYTQLNVGDSVASGDSVMVPQNGQVVLNVTDGTHSWTLTLPPGTYKITPEVLRTASGSAIASTGTNLTLTVGTILGAAVLGAAAVEEVGDTVPPVQPVSQ
jgi:hypothetical protein